MAKSQFLSGAAQAEDIHRRRWMMFVDGENFTFRGQAVARAEGIAFDEGPFWKRDAFLWFPHVPARRNLADDTAAVPLQSTAVRSYYYTSTTESDEGRQNVRSALRDLGFDPTVFKRPKEGARQSKGVDISLATDMLSHAFMNNYDVAFLVAGDGDYLPLVQQVKRLGKVVYGGFFDHPEAGLSDNLRLETDTFYTFWPYMRDQWQRLRGEIP
jgi:hypothetical protein